MKNILLPQLIHSLSSFASRNQWNASSESLISCARHLANTIELTPTRTLLTRKQCADLLGVSLPTLDKYIRQEGLPYRMKNPRATSRVHYLFSQAEVLEWSQSHLSGSRKRRYPK